MSQSLPWIKIHDFLLDCGKIRDHKEYSRYILDHIGELIPFDQGRLYFINDNGMVYDEYLLAVDKKVTKAYHEYYSKVENGRYSILTNVQNGRSPKPKVEDCVRDWTGQKPDEFLSDYVRPQGIRYSFGLGLRDNQNFLKATFSLDRVSAAKFSQEEMQIMYYIREHLENLHMNFYVDVPGNSVVSSLKEPTALTAREAEVAALLVEGVTPANISKKLYISLTTVYKHINHIHSKLGVSTRQELLVKLFQTQQTKK